MTEYQRHQQKQGGSVWLPVIALLLFLNLLLVGRSFWFLDYRLEKIQQQTRSR